MKKEIIQGTTPGQIIISSPDLQKCLSAFSVISRKSQLKFKHFVPSNGSY